VEFSHGFWVIVPNLTLALIPALDLLRATGIKLKLRLGLGLRVGNRNLKNRDAPCCAPGQKRELTKFLQFGRLHHRGTPLPGNAARHAEPRNGSGVDSEFL
jgi:hypothetical protein